MFESDEEREARQQRTIIIIGLVVGFIVLVFLASTAWSAFKPLPQLSVCEEKGHEAGMIINGKEICYNKCVTNEIESCKEIWVIT